MELRGKTIWLTGASSGIGRALALQLAGEGADLLLSSRSENSLKEVIASCRQKGAECNPIIFDLSKPADVDKAVIEALKHAPVDMLINNGGISQRAIAMDTGVKVDRLIMEVNYFAPVRLSKLLLPAMLKRGSGHIVCISSIIGKFGYPGRSAYAASKHGIMGFFDSLRAEIVGRGINITLICPGRISTDISLNALRGNGDRFNKMEIKHAKGMPAEKCAKKIISAIKKNKKEAWIGGKELSMIYLRNWAPALYYYITSRLNKAGQRKLTSK